MDPDITLATAFIVDSPTGFVIVTPYGREKVDEEFRPIEFVYKNGILDEFNTLN